MTWLERAPLVYDPDVAGHDEDAKPMHYETLFETRDPRALAVEWAEDADETFEIMDW